jgi:hypothetical protein
MKTLLKLFAAALAALALAACQTAPAQPAAAAPVVQKTTTDLLLEIRKAELELERTEQMAWLKFATESGSDLVKGFVMGRSGGKAAPAASNTAQTILQAQAQADATALRREELAERNSLWNRGLQLFDRAVPVFMFSKGLSFQRYQLDANNAQSRYTLDTVRGAQRDGFTLGSGAALGGVSAGSGATLGGVSAGAAAASAGARAVAGEAEPAEAAAADAADPAAGE